MRTTVKKAIATIVSISMLFSVITVSPIAAVKTYADSLVTNFSYDFAYVTPGYADGTISMEASTDGVYKVFWGDENGQKLTMNGHEYSYLARIVVKDGKGALNLENDNIAIPNGAETVLVYKKDSLEYTYNIPENKQFVASDNSYTFGSLSDPHYCRYNSGVSEENDDAIPAMKTAMDFLDDIGIEFVAMSGDLSQAGEQLAFDRFNAELDKHPNVTVITAIGNHDSRTTLSTSNKAVLDTSITRWYNSITSKYYTVEDGEVKSKLGDEYPILATDALTNPIDTQYRPQEGEDGVDTTVPGLDFVTEAGGNIFIIFNNIAKTGETYDTDKLLTTSQMDWLEEQLEKYKDRNVFLYQHYYLAVNTLDNDAVDYNNCTGDLKNKGNYSYDLDFKDVVKTTSGKNLQALLAEYKNTTLVTGHSHWQYSMQGLNNNINFGRLAGGSGGTMIHMSSVTEPRYIADDDANRTSLNGYASEGATITTYEDCTIFNNIDFVNKEYEAYATYIAPTGENSQYEPVKNPSYEESSDTITGDKYLEAEDLTVLQMLKSDYNLTLGASYVYSSKGGENTDTALTDGKSTGSYWNSKSGAKEDQYVKITLDEQQSVANLNYLLIYFVNGLTDSSTFNVGISNDGENFETIGDYSNTTYKTTKYDVDTSKVTFETFKYIKINLTAGTKNYGYQIREFALIGNEKNQFPNTAESASQLDGEAPIDYTTFITSDKNLIYTAEYTQSSVGSQNKEGALTDGSLNGFLNTERDGAAKDQEIIIDLGKGNTQSVSNIDYFLLYSQNDATLVTDFEVAISNDGETYETIGSYSGVDLDTERFDADLSNTTLEKFRFVKLHLIDGKTGYGYQIKEFALIGKEDIQRETVEDQSAIVADETQNLAYGKAVYVSSTYEKEGKDPAVLTDGKKDKYWSSDWDNTLTSDYIVVDLGREVSSNDIAYTLINYKEFATASEDLRIQFASEFDEENPTEGFVEVAKTKGSSWDMLLKNADTNNYIKTSIIEPEEQKVRYVKFLMNGHKGWGFQVYEVAVIARQKVITDAVPTFTEGTDYEYTGETIEPKIVLEDKGITLVEGKQYKIEYKDNTEVGTATATVTGLSEYAGVMKLEFNIVAKSATGLEAEASVDENGKVITSLKNDKVELVLGDDYGVSPQINEEGNLEVVFTTKGNNYEGTKTVIVSAETFPVLDAVLTGTESVEKNTIKVTFEHPDSIVAQCQSYDILVDDIVVKEFVEPGEYTITDLSSGKHQVSIKAHMGEKTSVSEEQEVNVSGKVFDEQNIEVTFFYNLSTYDGSEQTVDSIVVRDGEKELIKDIDYTISYENNVNAGNEACLVVTGKGLYEENSIRKMFTIGPKRFDMDGMSYDASALDTPFVMTGSEVKPQVPVYDGNILLEEDKDYTVSYENNIEPGTAKMIIVGTGNYTGRIDLEFTIEQIDIASSKVVMDMSKFSSSLEYNGKDRVQNISFTYEGNPLTMLVDYEVEYFNNNKPGTATVVYKGIGKFKGTITKTFTITKAKMSSVTVKASFNAKKQLVVSAYIGSLNLTPLVDFTYTSVTDIDGNVTVNVVGKGIYVGTTTVNIPAAQNPNPAVSSFLKKVSLKKVKKLKKKKAKVTWKKLKNVTGYQVYYSTKKSFKKKYTKKKLVTKNTSSVTLKKLKKKKYYVKVRCYITLNGKTKYGKWSNIKKVKIK